jgi:hypothetical protein
MEKSSQVARPPAQDDTTAASVWRVVGAAVAGTSHLRLGIPCQDAQAVHVLPSGDLIIALSDGAGSASRSELGAERAVQAVLAALADEIAFARPENQAGWEQILRAAAAAARQSVLQMAEEAQESPRAYAATLTCVVAAPEALAAVQIGDGTVVGMDESGELFTCVQVQRGEYANETHFITQDNALQQVTFSYTERPVKALAAMSDGLIRLALKMPSQEPHEPFFQPLFRFVASVSDAEESAGQLAAFLGSQRVNSRTDDDKSLVLAVRSGTSDGSTGAVDGSEG